MIIVYTQFHKKSLEFLNQFIKSANKEKTDNIKIKFIFNFNQVLLSKKELSNLKKLNFDFDIFFTNEPQHQARIKVLKKLKKLNFSHIIFIDSDDLFYKNRILKISKEIKKYDFLVNNLVVYKSGKILNKWIKFDKKIIKLSDVDDQNFIGLSNLTITKKVLVWMLKQKFNLKAIAFDWVLIKSILLNNFNGCFKKNIFTLYRKYVSNVIGNNKNYLTLKKIISEKLVHYSFFENDFLSYKNKIQKLKQLQKNLSDKNFRIEYLYQFKKLNQHWWQLPATDDLIKKKILFISGSRSEFNIINNLFLKCQHTFDTNIIVHAAHMQSAYGNSHKSTFKKKHYKKMFFIESNVGNSNSVREIAESFSKQVFKISTLLRKIKPNFIIVVGDRTETLAAATSSLINQIPIIHLHGGELSYGSIDEKIRHSITKMSSFHFCSTNKSKKRLIQLGEDNKKIKVIGAPSLSSYDSIIYKSTRDKVFLKVNKIKQNNFILVGLNSCLTLSETEEISIKLFKYLDTLPEIKVVTYPNPDLYNQKIIDEINKRIKRSDYRIFKYLGKNYFTALKNCKYLIGNSSSGIIEAPYFNKVFINIGTRQTGRQFSKPTTLNIREVSQIEKIINSNIGLKLKNNSNNLYYNKNCESIFINSLMKINLDTILYKKFVDLKNH